MIVFVILAAAVTAEPQIDCKGPESQAEMNRCSAVRANAADIAMTREWKRASLAMKRLDRDPNSAHDKRGGYFAALLAAQRAWLKFRGAQCLVEGYANRGGTLEPMTETDCYERLTKERTRQLRDLFRE